MGVWVKTRAFGQNISHKQKKWILYDVFLLALLITVNIYFGIFVFNKNDLSPNIALLVVTLVPIIIQIKIIRRRLQSLEV